MSSTLPALEDVKANPLLAQASEREREFIIAYIETGGNGISAAKRAYNCKNDESARVLARQVLARPLIMMLLSPPPSEEDLPLTREEALLILSDIARRNKKANPSVAAKAVETIARIQLWGSRTPESSAPESVLDAIEG